LQRPGKEGITEDARLIRLPPLGNVVDRNTGLFKSAAAWWLHNNFLPVLKS
jgi:hypothetical protein